MKEGLRERFFPFFCQFEKPRVLVGTCHKQTFLQLFSCSLCDQSDLILEPDTIDFGNHERLRTAGLLNVRV